MMPSDARLISCFAELLTDLSLRARLAIALRLFADYCQRRGLTHPDIAAYIDSLWEFIALPGTPEAFVVWEDARPPLIGAGLGDAFAPAFETYLTSCGAAEPEFRAAISCPVEILYSSLYGASDKPGSRRFVEEMAVLAASVGETFPDTRLFAGSRWADNNGWGLRPSPLELVVWRGDAVQSFPVTAL